MSNKPEWADSPKAQSPDGTVKMLQLLLARAERITFVQAENGWIAGEYFTLKGGYDYVQAQSLDEVIILLQEKLL